jgi:conjugal transfer pilus assembly protein TraV
MGIGSSEFACSKERETGIPCASPQEVYAKTNGSNWQQKSSANSANQPNQAAIERVASVTPMTPPNYPAPVLEPARVMRIWIAPWVDEAQSLHWPSYVFTEVTPRKWSYGNNDFSTSRQLVPVQLAPRQDPSAEAAPSPTATPPSSQR